MSEARGGLQVVRPDDYPGQYRTIVVLGAPRGGTSMVTGALRALGVFMGKNLGHQHEDPIFRKDTPLKDKLGAIAAYNAEHDVWGWKLPNSIYYYANVHAALRNPVFIVVYRNPMAVAASSARRDKRDFELRLLEVAINHYKRMHTVINQHPTVPLAVCSYEESSVAAAKQIFIRSVADFLKLAPSEEQLQKAFSFVDPVRGYQRL